MCRRCGEHARWRKSDWCGHCVIEACCRHYPRVVDGRIIDRCNHGLLTIRPKKEDQ